MTDAVSELTANTAAPKPTLSTSRWTRWPQTLDQVAPQLGPTFDGLSRLSRSLNGRNESLAELLKTAGDVTGIFSERSQQVNALILNANDLLGVLNDRRQAIVSLLPGTSALSRNLTGLVAENETGTGAGAGEAQRGQPDAGEKPRQHHQVLAGRRNTR